MSDLVLANSQYQSGALDTATTLVDNVDDVLAQHVNGPNSAAIQIETILGNGPTLKGAVADLATRLAVSLNTDGTIKAGTAGAFTGEIPVSRGGTGANTNAANGVLLGNGTSPVTTAVGGVSTVLTVTSGGGAPVFGQVKTAMIATATGSASGSLGASGHVNIATNDYSFFPNIQDTSGANDNFQMWVPSQADDSTTVGRFRLTNVDVISRSYVVRWRYITASDNPEIWVAYDPGTGLMQATWFSDDPLPNGQPGILMDGSVSMRITSKELESLTVLSGKASEAADYIEAQGMKPEHQAFRALQLYTGDSAPSQWLLKNIQVRDGKISQGK